MEQVSICQKESVAAMVWQVRVCELQDIGQVDTIGAKVDTMSAKVLTTPQKVATAFVALIPAWLSLELP